MVGPHGKSFAISFLWSSDDEEKGREYLAQVEKFGNVVMNTVASTTIPAYLDTMAKMVPTQAHGTVSSLNVRALTPEVIAVIATNLQTMPSTPGTGFVINELRGPSASPKEDSVFAAREPHFLLEFIATTAKEEDVEDSKLWIEKFYQDIQATDPENILTSSYISCKERRNPSFSIPLSKHIANNFFLSESARVKAGFFQIYLKLARLTSFFSMLPVVKCVFLLPNADQI